MLLVASAHAIPLASNSINAIVTSPPYFGLRSYEGDQEINWPPVDYAPMAGLAPIELPGCPPWCMDHEWKSDNHCAKCNGWRGALGYEPTVEMYVGHMILICRELYRVLRPDGLLWLNIADSYNGSGGAGGDYAPDGIRAGQPKYKGRNLSNLQAGDLIGSPARLALALQADGWIWRDDVVWAKHPMPEPRKGWRYRLPACDCSKERREAHIARQMVEQGIDRHRVYDKAGTKFLPDPDCPKCLGTGRIGNVEELVRESWRHTRSHEFIFQFSKSMHYFANSYTVSTSAGMKIRNPRSVIRPPRENYKGKHFAVFPPGLISPLIGASVPLRRCPQCSEPWAPIVKIAYDDEGERVESVTGYRPTCDCRWPTGLPTPKPGVILDPFMGSGTTGMVAKALGVSFIGLDISLSYLKDQAKIRTGVGDVNEDLTSLPMFRNLEK